jgi:predicted RNase H-like HicB family nuclease
MMKEFKINVACIWDAEAKVWVAHSDDLPGLVTEASNVPELIQRIMDVAPELIEDNLLDDKNEEDFLISLIPTYQQTVRITAH